MIVSLSHEIRVEGQDAATTNAAKPPVNADEQKAKDAKERQRIIDEYGIDATKEEIEEKEKERIKKEEDDAAEKKTTPPADLGQRKPREDKEVNANDIQNEHDILAKI